MEYVRVKITGQVTVSPALHMPRIHRHLLDSARTAIMKRKYIKPKADLSEWYMALDIPGGIWSLPMAFAQKSQFITTWGNPPPAAALPAHVCLGMNSGEFPSQWGLLGGRNVKGHGLAPGGRGDGRNWDRHTHATDTKYKVDNQGQPAVPQRELVSELSGGLSGKEVQRGCVYTHVC